MISYFGIATMSTGSGSCNAVEFALKGGADFILTMKYSKFLRHIDKYTNDITRLHSDCTYMPE